MGLELNIGPGRDLPLSHASISSGVKCLDSPMLWLVLTLAFGTSEPSLRFLFSLSLVIAQEAADFAMPHNELTERLVDRLWVFDFRISNQPFRE